MAERTPSSSAAAPRPLVDPPRPWDRASRAAVLLKDAWALWIMASFPVFFWPIAGGAAARGASDTTLAVVLVAFGMLGPAAAALLLRASARDLRILREGRLTTARRAARVAQPYKGRTFYVTTFTYEVDGHPFTHTVSLAPAAEKAILDEEHEWLLYDPAEPARAVLLDALPDNVRVGADGSLTPIPLERAVYRALPFVVVLGAAFVGLLRAGALDGR